MTFVLQISKGWKILQVPSFRRALRCGVAPSHEQRPMLFSLGEVNTVVDVGANVRQFSSMRGQCFPKAKFHSFEADLCGLARQKNPAQANVVEKGNS